MEQRRLGRTGLNVSAVGFGGAGIGREYGWTSDREAIAAVHAALDLGLTFFDVAPSYGDGLAESLLGQGLGKRRKDVVLMTKVDLLPEGREAIASFVKESVASSLKRLSTDYIDVLLVHNSVTSRRGHPYEWSIELEDAFQMADEFDRLRASGIVRHVGFSAWKCTPRSLDALFESDRFEVIQAEYNLLNTSAITANPSESTLGLMAELEFEDDPSAIAAYDFRGTDQHLSIARAKALGMGTVAVRPLMGGALADVIDRHPEPGSDLEEMVRISDKLRRVLHHGDGRLSASAVRFCLMAPEVDTVIPGFKNAAEVVDAVAASNLPPLDPAEVKQALAIVAGD